MYLFLMLRFIGVKELDIVSLLCPFFIGSGKLTKQHIFLLDGIQPMIQVRKMEISQTQNMTILNHRRTYGEAKNVRR